MQLKITMNVHLLHMFIDIQKFVEINPEQSLAKGLHSVNLSWFLHENGTPQNMDIHSINTVYISMYYVGLSRVVVLILSFHFKELFTQVTSRQCVFQSFDVRNLLTSHAFIMHKQDIWHAKINFGYMSWFRFIMRRDAKLQWKTTACEWMEGCG